MADAPVTEYHMEMVAFLCRSTSARRALDRGEFTLRAMAQLLANAEARSKIETLEAWAVRLLDVAAVRDKKVYCAQPVCKMNGCWVVVVSPGNQVTSHSADNARILAARCLWLDDRTLPMEPNR